MKRLGMFVIHHSFFLLFFLDSSPSLVYTHVSTICFCHVYSWKSRIFLWAEIILRCLFFFLSFKNRLPGLHKWLLPLLHGVFPNLGESYLKAKIHTTPPVPPLNIYIYLWLTDGLLSPQVIYKKFNIPCPLPDHNMNSSHDVFNGTDCEAKLLTVNSQVRRKHFHIALVSWIVGFSFYFSVRAQQVHCHSFCSRAYYVNSV